LSSTEKNINKANTERRGADVDAAAFGVELSFGGWPVGGAAARSDKDGGATEMENGRGGDNGTGSDRVWRPLLPDPMRQDGGAEKSTK